MAETAGKRIIEEVTEYRDPAPCKTSGQMEKICCDLVGELQCCKIVEPWGGYGQDDVLDQLGISLDEQGRDADGNYVVVEFAPRDKPCGEQVTDYDLSPLNCCDQIPSIIIDRDATPDILPAGEKITVYWSGGQPPFTVRTTSMATYLHGGHKAIVTSGTSVTVSALESFCGATAVIVSDACSTASMVIRSDQGHWVLINTDLDLCLFSDDAELVAGHIYQAIRGKYKLVEEVELKRWLVGGLGCNYGGTLIPKPGYEDTCYSGDCTTWYCGKIESARPPEAVMDVCLKYNVMEVVNDPFAILYCIFADGAVASNSGIATAYSCEWTNGAIGFGSKRSEVGYYLQSKTRNLYEWRC